MDIDRIRDAVKRNANENFHKLQNLGFCDYDQLEHIAKALIEEIASIELKMQISDRLLSEVFKTHEFKNMFQTGFTNGAYRPEYRAFLSNKFFDTPLEPYSLKNSEKYGFAFAKKAADDYGDNIVVFNKNDLICRTTATLGDSYNFSGTLPFLLDDINATIGAVLPNAYVIRQYFNRSKHANLVTDLLHKTCLSLPETIKQHTYAHFMELQFHGILSTDSIDHIYKI